ncbi:hypothetical protein A2X44_00475 [candidate division CPR3 bacterium GWF2_35_18]|uniref:Laminin G, sub domain 2 n=1 Tax=candidate division CPR3 bacterium GW2011_GWF2_35_18 TaxID=1618350 RepID=A0A0G0BL09_UNCC3|nr:MAG: Laminin G, sub domain 2 [candidate division CPR3 bacterium GW2011_GWF2_35_18]OGB63389.1 MAG: hypothetical protein A2X44_00475 [candidate division CPR3 bacterium GWF2_35_18]OGB64866.1 MAG: hypothetical protein A2250_05555 [candidate division CPR3 bacterium RIFOXYA2_FULL_35_13]OGB79458.1 MAG: hypothetical protein A2296_03025 [candidate division CPR3 bacterium RIFOXYB2_FULL_35_8]
MPLKIKILYLFKRIIIILIIFTISFTQKFYLFNNFTNSLAQATPYTFYISSNSSYYTYIDNTNNLVYIGTGDVGVYVINTHNTNNLEDDSIVINYNTTSTPALSSNSIKFIDKIGNLIYIGTSGGLDVIDNNGTVVATDDTINATYSTTSTPVAIGNNNVYASYLDTINKLLYISTYGGGVSVIDTQGTVTISDDTLLITYTTTSTPAIPHNNNQAQVYFDSDNNYLYIGTWGGGMRVFNTQGTKTPADDTVVTNYSTSTTPHLAHNNIEKIGLDSGNKLLYLPSQGSSSDGVLSVVNLNDNTSFAYRTTGVWNTTDSSTGVLLSSNPALQSAGGVKSVYVEGNLLYITHYNLVSSMTVINTQGTVDPSDDTLQGSYGITSSIEISSNYGTFGTLDTTNHLIYISTNNRGTIVVDTKNTASLNDDVYLGRYGIDYYYPENSDGFLQQSIIGDPAASFGAGQGHSLQKGDLNNDGYIDLAVGQDYSISSTGEVHLYQGTSSEIPTERTSFILGEKVNDRFGYSIFISDLNQDNYDDLIVNAVGSPSSLTGRVYIFWGRADFFETIDSYSDAAIVIDAEQAGSRFGGLDLMAVSDFNNDDWPDLALGAYKYDYDGKTDAGKTYVFFGGEHAWDLNLNAGTDADFTVKGDTANYYTGQGHYSADINSDNIDDLIISSYRYDQNYIGSVGIFLGPLTTANKLFSEADLIIEGSTSYQYLGGYQNFIVADIDNDNLQDIIIGLSGYGVSYRGGVMIFLGKSNYLSQTILHPEDADIILYSNIPYHMFGVSVVVNDWNNDGNLDLAVGGYYYGYYTFNTNKDFKGGVYIYYGNNLINMSGEVEAIENADLFITAPHYLTRSLSYGRAMIVGNFDYDEYEDLAILGHGGGTGKLDIWEIGNDEASISLDTISPYYTATVSLSGEANNPIQDKVIDKTTTLLDLGRADYEHGTVYDWDYYHTGYAPSVIKDGTTYKMWYSGSNNTNWRIGYATSTDGINWTKYDGNNCGSTTGDGCIFDLSANGNWDDLHLYGISVIKEGETYKMWYSGHDGSTMRIGYATSTDGITWTRNSGNNCLGTLGDGCLFTKAVNGNWDDAHTYYPYVIKDETIYKMWYTGHDGSNVRIGYATSNDGLTWTRNSGNNCSGTIGDGCVIPLGSSGETDDVHAFSGYVIKDNETYKMWYTGYDGLRYQIHYTTSPDGAIWTKSDNNPVLSQSNTYSIDKGSVYFGSLIKENGIYKMWYTGHDGTNGRLAYATSSDGVSWTKNTYAESNSQSVFLKNIQGKIDGGIWFDCTASDGAFDEISENYSCTSPSSLSEGTHTLTVRSIDQNEVYLPEILYQSTNFNVDDTLPTGSITINEGAENTNSREVILTLSAIDNPSGISQMILSENESFTGSSWESYDTSKTFTLSSNNGTKTVYAKYKDVAGNESTIYSDTIILDTKSPEGPIEIVSPSNNEYTNEKTITLILPGTDDLTEVVEMIISENPNFIGVEWESYSKTKVWTLSEGDGIKTIYIKYRDGAGNESLIYSASIILDTTTTINLVKLGGVTFNKDLTQWELNNSKPVFEGTGEKEAIVNITINSEPIIGNTTIDDTGNWSYTPEINIPLGLHEVTIISTDQAGNKDTINFSIFVRSSIFQLPDTGFLGGTIIFLLTGLISTVIFITKLRR